MPAVTAFRRLAIFERYALVEARPRTGRRHQIRRHFKHLSHPLIGDVRYGKGEHNRLFRERFGLHRLALHALELAFDASGDRRGAADRGPGAGGSGRAAAGDGDRGAGRVELSFRFPAPAGNGFPLPERGFLGRRLPDDLQVHSEIVVNQLVAHPGHSSPGQTGIASLKLR